MYRENKRFCFILAVAFLNREDIGGAYSYFRKAQSLDFRDAGAALGLAAVLIRRGESDKAVQLYIDVLERDSGNRQASRALDFLRRHAGADADAIPRAALRALYPKHPFDMRIPVFLGAIAALIAVGVLAVPPLIEAIRSARQTRPDVAGIELAAEERLNPVGSDGDFSFVLTQKEALETFDLAKRLFLDYRDEAALVEVNRLLLSNASRAVKAKVEALSRYAREPNFLTLPDRFSISLVSAMPQLYAGVGVAWKGLPANIASGPGYTEFDLLVGYHDKRRLDGIVAVRLPFETAIDPDVPVEVLARVRVGSGGTFHLEAIAIHSFQERP